MVKYSTNKLDAVFHALADPTRRGMLDQLQNGKATVSDLAEPYAMSLAAASKHIKKLEAAGLVKRQVIGRTHICQLDASTIKEARDWVNRYERFWTTHLDALEQALLDDTAEYDSEEGV